MSKTVDERVVKMEFDRQDFAKGVEATMKQLDELDKKLQLEGAVDGFSKVERAARTFSLKTISDGVDKVANRFSAMEVVALTALQNITNSAINAGKTLIKSFTLDPITSGFDKFGELTRSTGTLVSQGFDMDKVNAEMEKMMWFTDETSYNIMSMTDAVSKFTAAGMDLDKARRVAEGIDLWVASTGQDAQIAARAITQMSQAYGSGAMKRQDWMSITNMNLDTQQWREILIKYAKIHNTIQDLGDGTYRVLTGEGGIFSATEGFIDTLTKGVWVNQKVMEDAWLEYSSSVDRIYEYTQKTGESAADAIEALRDEIGDFAAQSFRNAQESRTFGDVLNYIKDAASTGWSRTYQLIIGDYKEARGLFTDLSDKLYKVFLVTHETRNEMLGVWKQLGGRTFMLEAFNEAWEGIAEAIGAVVEGFREVVPRINGLQLQKITYDLRNIVKWLRESIDIGDQLKTIGKGVGAAWKIVNEVLYQIAYGVSSVLFATMSALGISVIDVIALISEAIQQVYTWLQENTLIIKVFEGVAQAVSFVIGLAKSFFELPWTKNGLLNLGGVVSNVFSLVIGILGAASQGMGEFIAYLTTLDGVSLVNITEAMTKLGETIFNVTTGGVGVAVKGALRNLNTGVSAAISGADTLRDGFTGAVGQIFDFVKGLPWDNVIPLMLIAGLSAGIARLSSVVYNFTTVATAFANAIRVVSKSFSWYIDAKSTLARAETVLALAKAVGILVLALGGLAVAIKFVGIGNFVAAGVAVLALTGAVVGLTAAFMAFAKGLKGVGGQSAVLALGGLMVSMGIGIKMMVWALADMVTIISTLGKDGVWIIGSATAYLAVVSAFIAGVAILVGKFGGPLKGGMLFFLGFGVFLKIMMSVFKEIAEFKWREAAGSIKAMVAAMGILMSGMGAIIFSMSDFSAVFKGVGGKSGMTKSGGPGIGTAVTLISLVVSLKILVGVLKDLAAEDPGMMIGAMVMLVPLFGGLYAALMALKPVASAAKDLGTGFAAISMGLLGLIAVSKILSTMKISEMIKGIAGIMMFLLPMYIVVKTLSGEQFSKNVAKAGLTIMGISVSIALLGLVAGVLAMLPVGQMILSVIMLDTMIAVMAGVVYAISNMKDVKETIGTIKALGTAIGILSLSALALAIMGHFDMGAMLAGAAVIDIMMVVMAGCMKLMSSGDRIRGAIGPIITMGIIVGLLGGVVAVLARMNDPIGVLAAAGGLSLLLIALTGACAILWSAKNVFDAKLIAAAAVMVVVTGLLGGVLALIDNVFKLDPAKALLYAVSLSGLLIAMSAAATIVMFVPWEMAAVAAGKAMVFILGVAAMLGLLGLIFGKDAEGHDNIPGLMKSVEDGIGLINAMAIGLGQAIGNFFGAIADAFAGQLESAAQKLTGFVDLIGPFMDKMAEYGTNTKALDGAAALAGVMLTFAQAEFIQGINNFLNFSTDGTSLVNSFENIGKAVSKYWEYIKQIDDPDGMLKTSAETAKMLYDLGMTLPAPTDPSMTWFNGGMDLATFGTNLEAFGKSFKMYFDSISGIKNWNAIKQSVTTGKLLSDLDKNLPNKGGPVDQWMGGTQSLTSFGQNIQDFGEAMAGYVEKITSGKTPVEKYKEAVQCSVDAAEILSTFNKELFTQGVWDSIVNGDKNLGTFGTQISVLGTNLASYASSVSGIDWDTTITPSLTAANGFVDLANRVGETKNMASTLSTSVGTVKDAFTKIAALGADKIETGTVNLKAMIDGLAQLADIDSGKMKLLADILGSMNSQGMANFMTNIIGSDQDFAIHGEKVASAYISAIVAKLDASDAKAAIISFASRSAARATEGVKSKAATLGKFFVEGYRNGIITQARAVAMSATEVGRASLNALADTIQVHSPSEITERYGEWYGIGYTGGIEKAIPATRNASKHYGEESLEALNDVLAENSDSPVRNFMTGILDSAKKYFGDDSPMAKWLEETANNFMPTIDMSAYDMGREAAEAAAEGAAWSMENDEKLPKAAKSKAEQIKDIFAQALSSLSADISTTDLEYQLFTKMYGENSPQANNLKIQMLENKLGAQTERVNLNRQQYEKALAELGADSTDTKQFYQEYLQEQISLLDLTQQMDEANQQRLQSAIDSRSMYYKIMQEYSTITQWFSKEELEADARRRSGYDPTNQNGTVNQMTNQITQAMNTAYGAIQTTYQTLATDALSTVTYDAGKIGAAAGVSAAEGAVGTAPYSYDAGYTTAMAGVEGASDATDAYYAQGQANGYAYADGLSSASGAVSSAMGGYGGYGGYGGTGNKSIHIDNMNKWDPVDWEAQREEEARQRGIAFNKTVKENYDYLIKGLAEANGTTEEVAAKNWGTMEHYKNFLIDFEHTWGEGMGSPGTAVYERMVSSLTDQLLAGTYKMATHSTAIRDEFSFGQSESDKNFRTWLDWQYEETDEGLTKVVTGLRGAGNGLQDYMKAADIATEKGYKLSDSFKMVDEASAVFAGSMKRKAAEIDAMKSAASSIASGGVGKTINNINIDQTVETPDTSVKAVKKATESAVGQAMKYMGGGYNPDPIKVAHAIYMG